MKARDFRYTGLSLPKQYWGRLVALSGRTKIILISLVLIGAAAMLIRPALAAVVNVVPSATISNGWTANAACNASAHTCLDEGTTPDTADYISTGTSLQGVTAQFEMSNPTNIGVATSVTLYAYANSAGANGTQFDAIDMNLSIGGTALSTQQVTMTNTYTWYSVTYTGMWTQADMDNMQASFTRVVRGTSSANSNDDDVRIAAVYAEITYAPPVATTQAAYRFYQNNDDASSSFTTPSVRSSATSVTATVSKPAGTAAGDLLVLAYAADAGTIGEMTLPSGFTAVSSTTNGTELGHLRVATKVATGSEPTSYTVGKSSTASVRVDMLAIQNANTSISPVVAAAHTAASSTSHAAPSITPTGPNDLLLTFAAIRFNGGVASANWTAPSGMTEVTDSLSDGWESLTIARQALTSGSPTGSRTFALSAPQAEVAITVAMSMQGTGSGTGPSVGTPLAAQDTAAVAPTAGTPFRLRMNLGVSGATAPVGAAAYKLQYAQQGSDATCDASFTNESYTDVGATTPIKFYNNASAVDGVGMVTSANDPVRAGVTVIGQSYEEANAFSNTASIAAGQDGVWDFALVVDAGTPAAQYCLRTVRLDGSVITAYSVMPEIGVRATLDQAAYRFYENDSTAPVTSSATPSVRSLSSSVTDSVAKPSTIVAGDLLVMFYAADSGTLADMVFPSGFSELSATTKGAELGHLKIATKIATSSEPANYIVGKEALASVRLDVLAVQDADTSVAPVVNAVQTASSSTSHTAPSITPTGSNDLLLSAVGIRFNNGVPSASWTPPAGMTEISDSLADGWVSLTVARQALASGAATGTRTFSLSASKSEIAIAASLSIQGIDTGTGPNVGTPLAAQDTAATAPVAGTPFRLRLNMSVASAPISTNSSFKLQYATKAGGTCAIGGYADITTTSALKFYDNAAISDGYRYRTGANDPLRAGITAVGQAYKESNPFAVVKTVPASQDGLWDFVLTLDGAAPAATRYCIRAVTAAGVALSSYSQTAEVIVPGIAAATLSQQLRGGQAVVEGVKRPFLW